MSTLDLDAITREVDRVRHVHAEIQNHTRPGLVTGYLICVEQSADDVPHLASTVTALVAEVRRLRAELAAARPQVFTTEPGPEVTAVWDCDGDKWTRHPKGGWRRGPFGDSSTWEHLTIWAPITAAPAGAPVTVQPTPPAVELSDRQLLAAVHRWVRTHGWTWHDWHGWINASYAGDATIGVDWSDDDIGVQRRTPEGWRSTSYPVTSVPMAVDVLVALGVLPAELSTAWRAGQAARP